MEYSLTDLYYENYFISTFEFGGGLRINHVQFNVGRNLYLESLRDLKNQTEIYQKLVLSVSYMF